MISFLRGRLFSRHPTWIEIDVNGVGYYVSIPVSTFDSLPPEGEETLIYTSMRVREDDISLYGFITRKEHELFELLIKVNGIGPKAALAALSSLTTDNIYQAIINDSPEILSTVPGIGKKTAEKIIFELNSRIKRLAAECKSQHENLSSNDSVLALVSLGFRQKNVMDVVKKIEKTTSKDLSTEDMIKLALKKLSKNG